ncbi:DNA polymerase I [Pseudomarimonas arenosa]|uniref:DNA polymerase I n=1 Tax=Pseudomarimonas arenosa TaxID=2774145 RepID=A0AAW3ZPQ1_9GAMM|nr:DNA polymerase I [Pseudomarimonas arenosa]MBD8528168.1 DNA polymerase I [Pseudomarimonas arenosa]
MTRLVLIDGSSYLFRAYHALPKLSNDLGEPTGALFGVVNMLRGHLKEQPDLLAFVVDASGPTFRDDLYAEYKANRPPMPEDLRAQVEPMMQIVEALGIPVLRVSGVEADDVIGTLALQAAEQGIEVTISTGDKDFAQLVRPGVRLVNTMSGSVLDSDAAVEAKFGVKAAQIVDYLALMGDSVDNVPGVDKCGPKTAAKWLGQYGDLDTVMARADDIGGKIGENLRAALDRLPLSRQLVTIKTDVELGQGPQDLARREPQRDELIALYSRYGFNQALRELTGEGPAGKPTATRPAAMDERPDPAMAVKGQYHCVVDLDTFNVWLDRLAKADAFAFDCETDALDAMQANLVGLSFAIECGEAIYIPLQHRYPGAPTQLAAETVLGALKPLLENPAIGKIGQHGKYDLHVLRRHGIDVQGYRDDSMLASFVWHSAGLRHDMDTLAKRFLGYDTIKFEDVCGKGARQISFADVDLEQATAYAAEDADITLRLNQVFKRKLEGEPGLEKVYRDIEMPLVEVLTRMEANGVLIDAEELRRQTRDLSKRGLQVQEQAYAVAGRKFNLDSTKQLQALLYDELGLPVLVKTPKGQPSTNEDALEAIADQHELPRLILEHRSMAKLRSTYTEKLPEMINTDTGRVHTSYNQAGAATGRLSSTDPNLQNIPIRTEDGRRIRTAFIAPEGRRIVACDYSQIELRIMAHLSEDPGLMAAFESGQDVHRATAAEVFGVPLEQVDSGQRRAAKAINFGLMYGMGAFTLAQQLGIKRGEAQDYIALYFRRYPGVQRFMEGARMQAHQYGYVETVFGRRLHLMEINSRRHAQRAGAERAAINAPMQGSAADIIKLAMRSVHDWLIPHADKAMMIMQVHDELVFEVDTDFVDTLLPEVKQRMQAAVKLRVPLVVDAGVGVNWDEAH